ncbi:MAG: UvrD-helicase domain-containing protein [Armatimonadetes bacterium]|nr:UvrD-helicase domain-containing protein [Armatimonadota bacterium]
MAERFLVNNLDDLNPVQRQAVTHPGGPLLILAGAGSGKTRVLTYRVAHLIQQGVAPQRILAVTFTNKAANEMRERIHRLVGSAAQHCWMGTFHATCARILRQHGERLGVRADFVVFDDSDQIQLVKECLSELNISADTFKPRVVLSLISKAKEQLLGEAEYQRLATGEGEKIAARVYPLYQEKLRRNNALDFDDLILFAVRLLEELGEVRDAYQQRFQNVLVDEYQDINEGRYRLVRLLAARHRNLCVVGDDDQSIYSWRGSDVRFILAFEQDYPDATVLKLEQNYRSTQTILDAAHHVVRHIAGRREKRLFTENEPGAGLVLHMADDEAHEAQSIADAVEEAVARGRRRFGDFAVLYRINAQSRVLEETLRRRRIPHRVVGSLRFYDRKEIKDLIAYLRLLVNPADSLSLKRVINAPPRSIGAKSMERLEEDSRAHGSTLFEALRRADKIEGLTARARAALREFVGVIDGVAARASGENVSVTDLLRDLIQQTGYLRDLEAERTLEAQSRMENVQELVNVAAAFDRAVGGGLIPFLEQMALMSDQDTLQTDANAVMLMTLHAAKGLEFPCVFLSGLEEGLFPHSRALLNPSQLEEERRLCYVGLTRAREELRLSCARRRSVFGQTNWQQPSRFLRDIPEALFQSGGAASLLGEKRYTDVDDADFTRGGRFYGAVSPPRSSLGSLDVNALVDRARGGRGTYQPGDRVRHAVFGEGIVTRSRGSGDQELVSVVFQGHGEKKLVAGYARLEKIG